MSTTTKTIKDIKGNIIGIVKEVNGKKVWVDNHGKVIGRVISGK